MCCGFEVKTMMNFQLMSNTLTSRMIDLTKINQNTPLLGVCGELFDSNASYGTTRTPTAATITRDEDLGPQS